MNLLGWDIGGVNTKVARVTDGHLTTALQRPFELLRAPDRLVPLLRELAGIMGADDSSSHALTMTAELSQLFRSKREGVSFVLDAMVTAFPRSVIRVFGVDGGFLTVEEARSRPMSVAAANWVATSTIAATWHPDSLLIDIGTTTADIIPVVGGRVAAEGRTDPERLASGELVYTGAVRTPVEAIASHVPVSGVLTGVAAEGFALSGDVHLWRGDLEEADYTWPTPDGRPAARTFAGERLARSVCADRELLDETAVSEIADAFAHEQVLRISAAIRTVHARHPSLRHAVVTGVGAFLGDAAARAAGLGAMWLSADIGRDAARCAPAAAVALLLARHEAGDYGNTVVDDASVGTVFPSREDGIDLVLKVGGGLLADSRSFDATLEIVGEALLGRRAVIVPGGGPFADAVRAVDRKVGLDDEAAHWMAVEAMDLYAELMTSRLKGAVRTETPAAIRVALAAGRLPVLAPFRWLRNADPLPHSWEVTSDSIAAWVARALGARQLVLLKPAGARGERLTDEYFARAVPASLAVSVIPADQTDGLRALLSHHADLIDG